MIPRDLRDAYVSTTIATASPGSIIVMLCDRMVVDIQRAYQAQIDGDRTAAHDLIRHAQDILRHLQSTLNLNVGWDDAPRMLALYDYIETTLRRADLQGDQKATTDALQVAAEVADMWRQVDEVLSRSKATTDIAVSA